MARLALPLLIVFALLLTVLTYVNWTDDWNSWLGVLGLKDCQELSGYISTGEHIYFLDVRPNYDNLTTYLLAICGIATVLQVFRKRAVDPGLKAGL